jgi:flagellar assembly factor FliW
MSTQTIRIEHPLAKGAEVTEQDVWEFPEGLIGLAQHRRFALVPLPGAEPFRLLASLDDPGFGVVVVDPQALVPGYEVALPGTDLAPLTERDPARLQVLVPVVLPTGSSPMALNLKGPLVLSPRERRGVQRVSADDAHPVRWVADRAGAGGVGCSS